jgi:hypothetical protein
MPRIEGSLTFLGESVMFFAFALFFLGVIVDIYRQSMLGNSAIDAVANSRGLLVMLVALGLSSTLGALFLQRWRDRTTRGYVALCLTCASAVTVLYCFREIGALIGRGWAGVERIQPGSSIDATAVSSLLASHQRLVGSSPSFGATPPSHYYSNNLPFYLQLDFLIFVAFALGGLILLVLSIRNLGGVRGVALSVLVCSCFLAFLTGGVIVGSSGYLAKFQVTQFTYGWPLVQFITTNGSLLKVSLAGILVSGAVTMSISLKRLKAWR